MHDIVIRGGTVVDGSGAEPIIADVAVDANRITAIGSVPQTGRTEIDAGGHIVTPGFVDLHTHLDAQIGWDPFLTPLPQHGVTSALMGNCGMTFAPVRKGHYALLAEMMEAVEDIPAAAIIGGLPWNWESFGEYLTSIENLRPAINVGGLVGHCAVRFYVMGEGAVDEQPSDKQIAEMAELVAQSLDAGALGFSTSRLLSHLMPDGRPVPGTFAQPRELLAIAEAVAERGGLIQAVPNLECIQDELDLLRQLAAVTHDRVLFSLTVDDHRDAGHEINSQIKNLRNGVHDITATTYLRGSGVLCGLVNTLPWQTGAWLKLAQISFEDRLASLEDHTFRARLLEDAQSSEPVFSPEKIFWLGESQPDYNYRPENNLQSIATANDEHPATTFLRLSRETSGRALFMVRLFNSQRDAVWDVITGEHALPSLGDAGAHAGLIMDAGWCTYLLTELVRDSGRMSLAEGVRRMTSAPARLMGLSERGLLRTGQHADVNVIDLGRLSLGMPEYRHDFPGGAGRFTQSAAGYKATLCNGQMVVRDDELTNTRAGVVFRR